MKLNKLFIGLFGMLAVTLASCSSDDDYQRDTVSGAQVYFPNTLGATIETSTDASTFTVPVKRIVTSGSLTVPLNITMEAGSIYTPTAQEVTFADGESTAELAFSYDPSKVVYGTYYDISIAINSEGNTTNYGVSTYDFKAGLTAWVDMDDVATYREDIITAMFGVDNLVYEVDIQKNVVREGVYRLVNPYGEAYEYNDPGDWDDSQDYYLTIDASDPDHVWIEKGEMGVDWGYGMMSAQSFVSYYMAKDGKTVEELKAEHPEYFGTLVNGVITMPTSSLLFSMADYRDGAWYTGNGAGMFAVALPGARIADYAVEYTYIGRLTDESGNDFVRGKFKMGKDVYSVKYALVAASEDVDAVAEGIIDGSVESEEMKRSEAEPFEIAMDGVTGKYNLVVVVYDASGEAVSQASFVVKYQSSQDSAETWSAAYVGTYAYTVKDYTSSQAGGLWEGTQDAVLYVSDQNGNRYKIAPWADQEGENGLVFEMDEEGNLVVDGAETGFVDEEWGMIYATDLVTYEVADIPSYYENGVFYFNLAYHDYDGAWTYVQDTFTLTGTASAPHRAQGAKASRKQNPKKNVKLVRETGKAVD